MKTILALSFVLLGFNAFANSNEGTPIEVPYPTQQGLFYSRISRVYTNDVKKELTDKAIAVCGTKEKIAAIADVEVKIAFAGINIHKEEIEGAYPLASATAVVYCK